MSTFDAGTRPGAKADARSDAKTGTSAKAPARNSYDSDVPPNLLEFMLRSWRPAPRALPRVLPHAAGFRRRRERLGRQFAGEALVIPSGHAKVRANDTYYPFRPGTDFYYLTGNLEPDCVCVLLPEGEAHRPLLFVDPDPGRSDASFFTDRVKGALWEGPRLGLEANAARYGLECRPLAALEATLAGARSAGGRLRVLRGLSASTEALCGSPDAAQSERDQELATFLGEMRLLKDAFEIRALRSAIDATRRGFEDVIARLPRATSERELEGVFWTRARIEGNDVGYTSIVASGAHACTLHWKRNDGAVRQGDLLLLDAGIEGNSLYTADVTRTLPICGRFTPAQRAIYELVLAAQRAALAVARPGNDFMAPNAAAMRVLAEGLERLGILPGSAEEALRAENQFHRRYSLHNVSHMLGLDVHDCARARAENYKFGKLQAGMVLTIEPGLYFQTDDLTVPAKYRGIGVRIEDDIVITARGNSVLSAGLPTGAEEVEAWMREIWRADKALRAPRRAGR